MNWRVLTSTTSSLGSLREAAPGPSLTSLDQTLAPPSHLENSKITHTIHWYLLGALDSSPFFCPWGVGELLRLQGWGASAYHVIDTQTFAFSCLLCFFARVISPRCLAASPSLIVLGLWETCRE